MQMTGRDTMPLDSHCIMTMYDWLLVGNMRTVTTESQLCMNSIRDSL